MSFNSPAAAVGCYSTGEEIANSVTHGVAALLSIAGLVVMLSMMPVTAGAATITAAAVFGASMIFLYTASTLYHAIPNLRVKRILQVLDHSAIYVMIAGSYTPFCLVTLKGTTGTMLCIAVWSIALAGIILQPVLMKRGPSGSTACFICFSAGASCWFSSRSWRPCPLRASGFWQQAASFTRSASFSISGSGSRTTTPSGISSCWAVLRSSSSRFSSTCFPRAPPE